MKRAAVAATVLCVAGCSPREPKPTHARHLVVVTIDTLRADHVGAYGYAGASTPRLDALARDGAMALSASAHVPLTRPSHAALFTGRLPSETGIRDNFASAILPQVPLLAEVLKGQGFATGAFVSSVVLDSAAGFDRGFDVYADDFETGGDEAQFLNTVQRTGDVTTGLALAWLDQVRAAAPDGRVFLWLHLYDPHDPYEPPAPFASRFADRPYDGEIAFADSLVGRLDDALVRLGMRGDTSLVVTSDHGEGLGEHGETLHGFFAYQTTLAVPFFVRGPGVRPGTRLPTTVRLVDVFPTALDLLGVSAPPGPRAGRSLAPALSGGPVGAEPVVYAESLVPLLHFGWSDLRVLREGRYKYIQAPRPELYDLEDDPGETTNLASREPARAAALRKALAVVLDAERAQANASSPSAAPIAPELLEKLGALGYVGGAAPADAPSPGADPKEMVDEFRIANDLIREGLTSLHARDYAASAARFQAVLARKIASFEVHFYLARALTGLGRPADAARHYEEAARRSPSHGPAWTGLARSLLAAGRKAEARKAFEKALPLAPSSGALRAELGDLLREQGDVEGAIRLQHEATRLSPTVAAYWNSLGMTLGGNRRPAEAENAFREAVRLDARSHRYAYNLGLVLRDQGRASEARPWFEKALALEPRFAPARERLRELERNGS